MTNGVFSEYELREMAIKVNGESAYAAANCVGSLEEELEVKTVTKNCRGTVLKTRAHGAGNGTLNISMHIPYDIFNEIYGLDINGLKSGVKAYGRNSVHKTFSIAAHLYDEDGEEKYKAYPNCIIQSALSRSIENGADEVAEIELEVSVMPDDYGNCMYEALAANLTAELKAAWMTGFTPELVQGTSTVRTVTYTLSHVTSQNRATALEDGENYVTRLVPAAGYSLPSTITVTIGGSAATAGTDYIYNNTTGSLVIPEIDGNLTITATGTV